MLLRDLEELLHPDATTPPVPVPQKIKRQISDEALEEQLLETAGMAPSGPRKPEQQLGVDGRALLRKLEDRLLVGRAHTRALIERRAAEAAALESRPQFGEFFKALVTLRVRARDQTFG